MQSSFYSIFCILNKHQWLCNRIDVVQFAISFQKMYGVCIHPRYGGWFAIRGVLIFRNIEVPEFEQRLPPDVIPDNQKRIELLEQFNFNYQDWQFRDAVFPAERYSEQQKEYFITPPPERTKLIEKILSERPSSVDILCWRKSNRKIFILRIDLFFLFGDL